jgi:hypothetical protein
MTMTCGLNSEGTQNPFDWLVFRIESIDLRSNGGHHLPPMLRSRIVCVLERSLRDATLLAAYAAGIRALQGTHLRHNVVPLRDELSAIVSGGVASLDDGALVRLALNPVALWHLHYRIIHVRQREDRRQPWIALMNRRAHP